MWVPFSPSPSRRKSSKECRRLPLESPREGHRLQERSSLMTHRPSSMMSLQQDLRYQKEMQNKVSVLSSPPEKSPIVPELPSKTNKRTAGEDGSPYESSLRQRREQMTHNGCRSPQRKPRKFKSHQDSPETSKENEEAHKAREGSKDRSRSTHRISSRAPNVSKWKSSPGKLRYLERLAGRRSTETLNHSDSVEAGKKNPKNNENSFWREVHPGTPDQRSMPISDERGCFRQNEVRDSDQSLEEETVAGPVEKDNHSNRNFDSDLEEKDKYRSKRKGKRKHKRSERHEVTCNDDYSSDSEIEDRKEAKRRRKEERRLQKEKCRQCKERHCKRKEGCAEKLELKNQDDSNASDGGHVSKKEPYSSDDEETVSDQKKLEIELRKNVLESLKARKGISH